MIEPANLFLIGARGTGKSTIATLVANMLGWTAVDADRVLEHQLGQQSIVQVFAELGEEVFRSHEAAVLELICQLNHQVVATGGGVVLRQENRVRLRASGWVVWLQADAETLWQRLLGDAASATQRPALTALDGLTEMKTILQTRTPLYGECADLTVQTAGRSPQAVAEEIVSAKWGGIKRE